jgi:chemotaxis family two-component system response regulator Rcp1
MDSEQFGRPFEILLVEDNPAEARLILEVFKEARVVNNLSVVGDGADALGFLWRKEKYASAPRPDLILLDLNLSQKSGVEVLEVIKTDKDLRRIPVVILTLSRADEDIIKCYNLHANCYIAKPVDPSEFINILKSIEEFWLTAVRLPTR